MSTSEEPILGSAGPFADEQVDVRRYLGALWRGRWLVALIVVLGTGAAIAASLVLPKTYQATATIVFEGSSVGLGLDDAESIQRRLATANSLITSPDVLAAASRGLPGETQLTLDDSVGSAVAEEANIINVVAQDEDPRHAADVANTVADAFLARRTQIERRRLADTRSSLRQQLDTLGASPEDELAAQALRERISRLGVNEPLAGSELQLAQTAQTPTDPRSPRPVRNGVLALFASLFLGILVALAREQLVPRVSGQRELSRLTGMTVLSGIPYVGRRFARHARILSGVEEEGYQTLRASLKLTLPSGEPSVVLVTSAVHGEGKTTVTARLGRALAQAGHRVLLISADLRWPTLHEALGAPVNRGLSDILDLIDRDAGETDTAFLAAVQPIRGPKGDLHLLTSGTNPSSGARLLSSDAMTGFFDYVRRLDYDYVLVDSPPLLGIADSQVLARQVDRLLVVVRLDRVTLDNVIDMREALGRLETSTLGLVVIGTRLEASPYYLGGRARALQDIGEARG